MQNGFADRREPGRVGECARQPSCSGIKRPWRAATARRAAEITRELDQVLRRPRPITFEQQDDGRARRCGQADECPVLVVRAPHIHAQTKRHADGVEGMRTAVDEMRERRNRR